MMAAFTAVVVVQWLWIKYAIRERETKFTSQVYDVLNRVVNRIDEFNYLRYKQEMNEQIGEIKNYNDLIASQQGGTSSEWYSNNLFNILNNDINRLKGERSYLFSVVPYARSGIGKKRRNILCYNGAGCQTGTIQSADARISDTFAS